MADPPPRHMRYLRKLVLHFVAIFAVVAMTSASGTKLGLLVELKRSLAVASDSPDNLANLSAVHEAMCHTYIACERSTHRDGVCGHLHVCRGGQVSEH